MKTTLPIDPGANRQWFVVDADGKPLGRLAVKIVGILRGKHKAIFTPHVDMGDFVVVVNAGKVKLTGRKDDQKVYLNYSGWRGGLKEVTARVMRDRHPDRMIKRAVKRMLPKSKLSRTMFGRLKVYAGGEHPHVAQKPQTPKF